MNNMDNRMTFTRDGRELVLSCHAFHRLKDRFNCSFGEQVKEKVNEIITKGYSTEFKRNGNLGIPKEEIITYQDVNLHIRENTIVTAKYNMAFYGTTHDNRGRGLNKNKRYR